MRNLTIHTDTITEGKAADAIFDACRANEGRIFKGFVTFKTFPSAVRTNNEHFAYLWNVKGEKIATAIVDQWDV